MSTAVRHQVLLVAICSLTFFINLGATHLWEEDEAYFGRTAQEMRHRHDYLVPYFNGQISLHKPILLFWVILASFQCWGENEFAARFGSALFGIGNVILVYHLGRRLFSEQIGFWSALVLGTCLHFVVVSRAAVADPELIFFCTLPMLIFVAGTRLSRSRAAAVPVDAAHPVTAEELSWLGWVGIYASMGVAALTKGPVGFVLPTAVIGLFLLLSRADYLAALKTDARRSGLRKLGIWLVRVLWPSSFLRTVWSMRPITALMMLTLVAAPWYVAVGYLTNGEWPRGFFFVHNVGRFVNSFEGHDGGPLYYVLAICVGTFPWCLFNFQTLHQAFASLRRGDPSRPAYLLLLSWIVVWVGAFTFAGTKLPHYVLPAYPAIAILIGAFIATWLTHSVEFSRTWLRVAWLTLVLVGLGILTAMPMIAQTYAPGEESLARIGIIPLLGGVAGLIADERGRRRLAASLLGVVAVVFCITLLAWGAVRIDRQQTSPVVARWIKELAPGEHPTLAALGCFEASLLYYCDQNILQLQSHEQVRDFFTAHPSNAFLITTDRRIEGLQGQFPTDVNILRETRRFLRPESLVLLGRSKLLAADAVRPADSPAEVDRSLGRLNR